MGGLQSLYSDARSREQMESATWVTQCVGESLFLWLLAVQMAAIVYLLHCFAKCVGKLRLFTIF